MKSFKMNYETDHKYHEYTIIAILSPVKLKDIKLFLLRIINNNV
jgi:hypothetical protein